MNTTKIRDYTMFDEKFLHQGLYGATAWFKDKTKGLLLMNDTGIDVSIMDVRSFLSFGIPQTPSLLYFAQNDLKTKNESWHTISTLNTLIGPAVHEIKARDKSNNPKQLQFAIQNYCNDVYAIFVGNQFETHYN